MLIRGVKYHMLISPTLTGTVLLSFKEEVIIRTNTIKAYPIQLLQAVILPEKSLAKIQHCSSHHHKADDVVSHGSF